MASISSNVTLAITTDVDNVNITVQYMITGSAFDIKSGQPYRETVRLIGDDTPPGVNASEDNVDDTIVGGLLYDGTVVFSSPVLMPRLWTKKLGKTALNEDNPGVDEIRAVVKLTPIPAATTKKESNMVTGDYN